MPKTLVVLLQPLDKLRLAFLGMFLCPPWIDQRVRLTVINTVVRTAIKHHKQQRPRLFGFNGGEHHLNDTYQPLAFFPVAQDRIGRQQKRIELAAHHVGLHREVGILLQRFGRQCPILVGRTLVVTPAQGLVQLTLQPVVVQMSIEAVAVRM